MLHCVHQIAVRCLVLRAFPAKMENSCRLKDPNQELKAGDNTELFVVIKNTDLRHFFFSFLSDVNPDKESQSRRNRERMWSKVCHVC